MKAIRLFSIAVALSLTALLAACGSSSGAAGAKNRVNSSWPTTLTLGEEGVENSSALTATVAPLQKLIKRTLDINVKVTTGTSYAALIEAQKAGKAQLVYYGAFSYYVAQQSGLKIDPLATTITAPGTDGSYHSLGVVNPKLNPGINGIKDFAGKKTCFSDPSSTSAYLYPSYGLLTAGISPTKGLSPLFSGTDTATAVQVAKGICQDGFTNDVVLPQAESNNAIDASDIKVVWTSPTIPGGPVAASDSLPASLRSALKALLLKADAPYLVSQGDCSSVQQCTKVMGQYGFAPSPNSILSQISKICAVIKGPQCAKQ